VKTSRGGAGKGGEGERGGMPRTGTAAPGRPLRPYVLPPWKLEKGQGDSGGGKEGKGRKSLECFFRGSKGKKKQMISAPRSGPATKKKGEEKRLASASNPESRLRVPIQGGEADTKKRGREARLDSPDLHQDSSPTFSFRRCGRVCYGGKKRGSWSPSCHAHFSRRRRIQ